MSIVTVYLPKGSIEEFESAREYWYDSNIVDKVLYVTKRSRLNSDILTVDAYAPGHWTKVEHVYEN
jgi:hypothetical protein